MKKVISAPIYQGNSLDEIMESKQISGSLTIADFKKRGNFGIGSTKNFIGELMFLDGEVHYIAPSGKGAPISDDTLAPFTIITTLKKKEFATLEDEISYEELLAYLPQFFYRSGMPHAIRISGLFNQITVRSLKGFPDKKNICPSSVAENRFTHENIQGTMIGFYFSKNLSGFIPEGFHFHFISDDRMKGGHLYTATPMKIKITVQPASEYTLGFTMYSR